MPESMLPLVTSIARMRQELQQDPERFARLRRVQDWQSHRLSRTYGDFLFHPRYRDALNFFVRDLYGPHDFSQRDRDLQRVLATWERALPDRALNAVRNALELEALTEALDVAVLDALGHRVPDVVSYAGAYRKADRRPDRQRQIWLILSAGRALNTLVGTPWVSGALRLARTPARLAGVHVLHDFLERGYRAFEKMGDAEELLRSIERRETRIMQRLFAGTPAPFDLPELESLGRSSRKPQS
ncbi:MAG: hypothetical protein ABW110_00510 [Steroidobacteraceae bacterium]